MDVFRWGGKKNGMNIPLWPDLPPTQTPGAEEDRPYLVHSTPFGQAFAGAAVLILPGGGYSMRSEQEGEGFAGMFRLWGLHTFVCHYRVGTRGHRHPAMLEDAARALRTIRSRAGEFGVNPERILVIGSSAGGHLAATLLTHWDAGQPDDADPVERVSSRPDLGVLCYPVITMGELSHGGSRLQLLGPDPAPELVEMLSLETRVTPQTPPTFLWHTVEDSAVPVENSLFFAAALRKAGVPFEAHFYEKGGHGLGMKDGHPWVQDCWRWLQGRWGACS